MKRNIRVILRSLLALSLAAVMLLQLIACSIPADGGDESTGGTQASTQAGTQASTQASTQAGTQAPTQAGTQEPLETEPGEIGSEEESRVEENLDVPPVVEVVDRVSVQVRLSQKQPLVGVETPKDRLINADRLTGFGVAVHSNADDGLSAYVATLLSVSYDTAAAENGVTDTVTVNDVISLERGYYTSGGEDGFSLSTVYAEFYEVEVDYTEDGRIAGLYYYDRAYTYHYDLAARLVEIRRDGAPYKTFSYNAGGNLVSEKSVTAKNAFEKTYAYTEAGVLHSVNGKAVKGAALPKGLSVEYGYAFEGTELPTKKTVGGVTTSYKYVGDKVVEATRGDKTASYILDKDLNYVGILYDGVRYYFAVDPFGTVMGIADCDGNFVVEYQYDAWGTVVGITGEMADTLGKQNEIVNLNGLYDHTLHCYLFGKDVYLPACGATLRDGASIPARDLYAWAQSNYFARSAVSTFSLIHDMVIKVALDNLRGEGVDVVGNLYVADAEGNNRRLADIYTLPYEITPFSTMNLLNGNQVYEVVYHAPESQSFLEIALEKLHEITDPSGVWSVSYYADYQPSAGTMSFHGQFVYLDLLVDYRCTGNGVVEYQVKKNTLVNYDQTLNIYDYDNKKYVCYVNNTFDLEFLEGVTVIPGINREQYEAIDGYLSSYLQSVAGNICDKMLIYDDPNYYDLETMNVTPDYWARMNLEDTTTYLEIGADGTVNTRVMPAWETDAFRTKLTIGAGAILITAIVATLAVVLPGGGSVVISICLGAAKGAATGALSGFAIGLVTPVIEATIERVRTGEWPQMSAEEFFNRSLNSAAQGFLSGAVSGAILGGISGALFPSYGAGVKYKFGEGGTGSVGKNINKHFARNGADVGAANAFEYAKKASDFADDVFRNGVPPLRTVNGAVPGVYRFEYGEFYIHMTRQGEIVSFGKLFQFLA